MPTQTREVEPARPIRQLLYAMKWVILGFVLVATLRVDFASALVQRQPIYVAVAVIALVTLISQLAGKRSWLRNPLLSLVADIALVTTVTYFSDGIQSPFYPLYYLTVITAAVDFGLGGALMCATVVGALSIYIDFVSPTVHTRGQFMPEDIARTVPFLFLIALITGALRSRIRTLDEAAAAFRANQAASEREMEVAARVQRAQLPIETPTVKGIRIATTYKPAKEVGGDLYDFYPVGDDCVGIIVADVSGKGVPAALLLSSCKYAVRESYAEDLSRMISAVNQHILSVTADETFVTMLYGVLDVPTRTFRYINAGHMPPMIVKQPGKVISTEHSDPPLGIISGCNYVEQSIQMEPGDALVLYTDGVTDAMVAGDGGIEALQDFLAGVATSDLENWGGELLRRTAEPHHLDDITMVALQLDQ